MHSKNRVKKVQGADGLMGGASGQLSTCSHPEPITLAIIETGSKLAVMSGAVRMSVRRIFDRLGDVGHELHALPNDAKKFYASPMAGEGQKKAISSTCCRRSASGADSSGLLLRRCSG
jgi:hypothetical protein